MSLVLGPQKVWRKYPESDFEVLIQPLTGSESDAFDKRNQHSAWSKGNPFPEKDEGYHVLRAQAVTKDWKGLTDPKGVVVPCNKSAIEEMYEYFPKIIHWILAEEAKIQEGDAAITIGETKN